MGRDEGVGRGEGSHFEFSETVLPKNRFTKTPYGSDKNFNIARMRVCSIQPYRQQHLLHTVVITQFNEPDVLRMTKHRAQAGYAVSVNLAFCPSS